MLEVIFREDGRQRPSSFVARGHAAFAESGEDIVCAAVSAILQAARLGLESHAGLGLQVDQHTGNLAVRWPESARERDDVRAIVATARLAVEQIAAQYPSHVRTTIEPEPIAR